MGSIILLSGPVGAGKTTVAKELVAISKGLVAYIEGDCFWKHIVKHTPDEITDRQGFRMIMTSMVAAAIPYAMNNFETIIDFTFTPRFLDVALKMLTPRQIPLHYIVLLPSETVCADRAASRCEGQLPDYSTLHNFYEKFLEAPQYHLCDNDSPPEMIASQIRLGIDQGKYMVKPD